MTREVLLVVPEASPVQAACEVTQRRLQRTGLRIGVLDNSKGNADHLLRFIVESMKAALPVQSVVALRKNAVSLPAPPPILDQLTREADVVVRCRTLRTSSSWSSAALVSTRLTYRPSEPRAR